jgi:uncharacterized protein involved in outer membrane biogenesis
MRLKKIIIGVFLLLISLVALAVALVFSGVITGDHIKPYIVSSARSYVGYDLDIKGSVDYKLLPVPHVQISDITAKPYGQGKAFQTSIEKMDMYVSLVDLLKGRFVIDSLKLFHPEVKMSDMSAWRTPEIDALMAAGKAEPSAAAANPAKPALYSVKNVVIEQGDFTFGASADAQSIKDMNLKLTYNILSGHYDVNFSLLRSQHKSKQNYTGQLKVNLQDVAHKIVGLDGLLSLPTYKMDVDIAGIVSWDNGLSYQGETHINYAQPLPINVSGGQGGVSYKALVSLSPLADKQGYAVQAKKGHVQYGVYKYDLSLSGEVMGAAHLATFDYNVASNLGADVVLSGSLERALGNVESSGKIRFTSPSVFDVRSHVNILKQKYDVHVVQKKSLPPKIEIKGDKLNFVDLYKKREVVAKKQGDVFELYLNKGQDHFHRLLVDTIASAPALPASSWNISLGEVVYQKQAVKKFQAAFDIDSDGALHVDSLKASYLGRHHFSLEGDVNAAKAQPRYDLKFAISVDRPAEILPYFPPRQTDLYLNLSGDNKSYNWNGKVALGKDSLSFTALHKAELPKGHVSMLLLDIDFKDFVHLSDLPAFKQTVEDFNLSGAAKLTAQIGLLNDKTVQLDFLKGNINKTAVNVSGTARFIGQKPDFNLALKADKLIYTPRPAIQKTKTASGESKWSRKEVKLPVSTDMKAAVDFKVDDLRLDKSRLSDVSGQLSVSNSSVAINNLSAKGYGGTLNSKASYKTTEKGALALNVNLSSIETKTLFESFFGAKKPSFISGTADFDAVAQSSGRSSSALIYGLSGQGKLGGQAITLYGIDVAKIGEALRLDTKLEQNIAAMESLVSSAMEKGQTVFTAVSIPYKMDGGVIKIEKGVFEAKDYDLWVNGEISLTNNTLNLRNIIIYKGEEGADLPKVPFTIKGPLNAPVKDITSQIMQEFIKNKLSRKLNKTLNSVLQDLLPVDKAAQPQQESGAANDNVQPSQQNNAPKIEDLIDPAQLLLRRVLGQ